MVTFRSLDYLELTVSGTGTLRLPFDRWSDWGHEANLENPFALGSQPPGVSLAVFNIPLSTLHKPGAPLTPRFLLTFPGATWRVSKNMIGSKDRQICLLFWNWRHPVGWPLCTSTVYFIDGEANTRLTELFWRWKQCIRWIFSGSLITSVDV